MPTTWYNAHGRVPLRGGTQCWGGRGTHLSRIQGGQCLWFTNFTRIKGRPTIDRHSSWRTYKDMNFGWGPYDWTSTFPWRKPGTADIFSPCGVDGGNKNGCPVGNRGQGGCAGQGYGHGPDARTYNFPGMRTTTWQAGSIQEAGWGIEANHGGGYIYRLCKLGPKGRAGLTEECFRQGSLKFHGDMLWLQHGGEARRYAVRARRLTSGTSPQGSQWTQNPIPGCKSTGGNANCPQTWYTPPLRGIRGNGVYGNSHMVNKWLIIDKLEVPADLTPGQYALSWRWDSDQTPQVWHGCSAIRVTPGPRPTPRPTPPPPAPTPAPVVPQPTPPPAPVVSVPDGMVLLEDGCRKSQGLQKGGWVSSQSTWKAGYVMCCSSNSCTRFQQGTQCLNNGQAATFKEAFEICASKGMSLCTQAQLHHPNAMGCCGSGCGFDGKLVWTSTVKSHSSTIDCPTLCTAPGNAVLQHDKVAGRNNHGDYSCADVQRYMTSRPQHECPGLRKHFRHCCTAARPESEPEPEPEEEEEEPEEGPEEPEEGPEEPPATPEEPVEVRPCPALCASGNLTGDALAGF